MIKIPKLKKKISAFLTKEDGRISKEKLIKTGVLLSAVAIASLNAVEAGWTHTNTLSLTYDGSQTVTGGHDNHSSHSSHSSHGQW